jgi:hypothetical protein
MATGRMAFSGNSTALIFEAILNRVPTPPLQLNADLPPKLEEIINKALEKERDLRYQVASEMSSDLKRLKRDTDSARAGGTPLVPAPSVPGAAGVPARHIQGVPLRHWPLALAVLLTLIVVWGLVWFVEHRAPPAPPAPQLKERRLTANPSENPVTQGAISPDGKYLAYGNVTGLHLKLIQTGETVNIPQPEGPGAPSAGAWWPNGWFPDGSKFIAAGIVPGQPPSAWVVSAIGGPLANSAMKPTYSQCRRMVL